MKTNSTAKPLVSIISISYNQEKYIRDMIEGFLMQKTNFDYEVIIADDCSTDKTGAIIKEYEKKHPRIFRSLHRKKNMGAIPNLMEAMKHAKGDYIALCEGDDYWTDSQKLQKQIDFMQGNPDYSICFHPVKVIFEDSKETRIFPEDTSDLSVERLLRANFIQTNSVVYRRQDYSDLKDDVMPGDWYLHFYHARFGKIKCINDTMSVYRRHSKGLWWDSQKGPTQLYQKYAGGFLALFAHAFEYYSHNAIYKDIVLSNATELITALAAQETDLKRRTAEAILLSQPELLAAVSLFVAGENDTLSRTQQKLTHENETLKADIEHKRTELRNIKESKAWKAIESYRKLKAGARKKEV